MDQLTKAEQDYAERCHSLVYGFLNTYRLNEADYYDVVIFGYLKAVKRYLANKNNCNQYAFSTIAYRDMRIALMEYWKFYYRECRYAETLSLDVALYPDSGYDFYSAHGAIDPGYDDMLLDLEMRNTLSTANRRLINLMMAGYSKTEISQNTGTDKSKVDDAHLYTKLKMKDYFDSRDKERKYLRGYPARTMRIGSKAVISINGQKRLFPVVVKISHTDDACIIFETAQYIYELELDQSDNFRSSYQKADVIYG